MIAAAVINIKPVAIKVLQFQGASPLQAQSRQVSSNQHHTHPKLPALVRKHLDTRFRKPVAAHNLEAFEVLMRELAERPRPLVLDSFCGTGHSTAALARRHPDHLVVGIDKSAQRLGKHPGSSRANYLLLQAECEDLWQLLALEGLSAEYHYLLYPNPWPKAKHLQRRVHASASFPVLLQLARQGGGAPAGGAADQAGPGRIEVRSNWQIYVEEFGVAMHMAGVPGYISQLSPGPALSLFESKYANSGHILWVFTCGRHQDVDPPQPAAK
jgi:tRNA (guanine-N7-)-methyltransferase